MTQTPSIERLHSISNIELPQSRFSRAVEVLTVFLPLNLPPQVAVEGGHGAVFERERSYSIHPFRIPHSLCLATRRKQPLGARHHSSPPKRVHLGVKKGSHFLGRECLVVQPILCPAREMSPRSYISYIQFLASEARPCAATTRSKPVAICSR